MSSLRSAKWDPSTPAFNSYENGAPLTTDYNLNTDGRFPGILQLGPLLTTIALNAADGAAPSVTNVKRGVFSESMETEDYLAVIRGKRLATVATSTRTLTSDGTATAFSDNAVWIHFSKAEAGTEFLSVPLTGTGIEQEVTAIGGASYTFTANNESIINRVLGSNTSRDAGGQVFGLGVTASVENTVRSNSITGAVTPDASAWVERSLLTGPNVTFTGIAWWNNFIYVGTNNGPYYVNDDFQAFQLRIPEAANAASANNCSGMFAWSKLGVVIPMERETRLFVGPDGVRMGPEAFDNNTSIVRGRITGGDANELWAMVPVYNPFTDQTFLCAIRPRMGKENSIHRAPVSYFPIAKLTDGHECQMVKWAGTKGSVANGTWYCGDDDDLVWFVEGKTDRFPDDTALTYAASGTWYGTEIRRDPDKEKKPVCLIFETANCAVSNETVTVNFRYIDRTGTARTTTGGVTVTTNGKQIIPWPKDMEFWATRFRPEIALARGATTTNTPRVIGDFEVIWEERDAMNVEGMYFDMATGAMKVGAR